MVRSVTPAQLPQGLSIAPASSQPVTSSTTDLKALQEEQEKQMILKVLKDTKYNKSKTAKLLNIDRTTLYAKIKHYGIDA